MDPPAPLDVLRFQAPSLADSMLRACLCDTRFIFLPWLQPALCPLAYKAPTQVHSVMNSSNSPKQHQHCIVSRPKSIQPRSCRILPFCFSEVVSDWYRYVQRSTLGGGALCVACSLPLIYTHQASHSCHGRISSLAATKFGPATTHAPGTAMPPTPGQEVHPTHEQSPR